jgi:molybdopterin converting factor small subunit
MATETRTALEPRTDWARLTQEIRMQIQLEVFGTLRDRLKERLPGGRGTVEVADGATIEQLAEQLSIAIVANCVVMIDGQMERNRTRQIEPNTKVTLIPPVAGG